MPYITSKSKFFFSVVALVLFINVIFYFTYPMNVAHFDYAAYLGMMYNRVSNLILASGYPAVFIILLKVFNISNAPTMLDVGWLNKVQNLQLIVHLCILLYCTLAVAKLFNKLTAVVMCVIWGLGTVFMSNVNSGAPEWLHGEFIFLSILLSVQAWASIRHAVKIILYLLSAAVFTFAYLVKFNSLVLLPVLCIIIFFDDMKIIRKSIVIIGMSSIGFLIIVSFVKYFHYPSSKTRALSYDHAWVLLAAIPNEYFSLPVDQLKINTLRWKALSSTLAADYSMAGAYCCVTEGAPVSVRSSYHAQYSKIMQLTKNELVTFVLAHPLPSGFIGGASAVPIYWYYGLKEGDELGIEVYKESLTTIPLSYAKQIYYGFINSSAYSRQLIPFYSNKLGETLGKNIDGKRGFVSFKPPTNVNAYAQPYYNPSEQVWSPGVRFFEILSKIIMPRWLELLLFFTSITGLLFTKDRKIKSFGFLFLAVIMLFATSSFMLLGMRTKEFTSITPILAIFYGLGLSSVFFLIRNKLFKIEK